MLAAAYGPLATRELTLTHMTRSSPIAGII